MESTKTTISVIVPIYNSEKYVTRLLDSFLSQTFTDWELIAINDGSTDDSGKIINDYASKDSRIIPVHKQNAGVSAARQTGMNMARGKYIIHADSDDWAEPDMLKELYDKAISSNADVVICDYYVDNGSKQTYVRQEPNSLVPESVLRQLFHNLLGSCWNKLIKTDILHTCNIHFPDGINYCEDLLVCVQLFMNNTIKIAYVPKAFYHYVQNMTSITHAYTLATYRNRIQYQQTLEEYLPIKDFGYEIRKSRLNVFLEAYMQGVLPNKEAWSCLWKNRKAAFIECKSPRWKLGFIAMFFGCFPISKKLLKY